MCGIIGILSQQSVVNQLLDGLKRLEYRGYDSAGVASLQQGEIKRFRAEGKLHNLEDIVKNADFSGTIGIGHTRWATHGIPNETNAHPHATEKVAVVHNGIIENYLDLKNELLAQHYSFNSETDTEVVPVLITSFIDQGLTAKNALAETLQKIKGAFALGVIFADEPDTLYAARKGSPLAIGYGDNAMYIGSDAIALAPFTSEITYLEDGDWAELTLENVSIFDVNNSPVNRPVKQTALTGAAVGKGDYRHYMLKEIYEQPTVLGDALSTLYNPSNNTIALPELPFELKDIDHITMIACGTAYYAAMVAKYWLESLGKIRVEVDIASEFRYREPALSKNSLAIVISQSGETADTLAALRYAKSHGLLTLGILNTIESSIDNESDATLHTHAGPEIGVASTKAFTAQLMTLAGFSLAFSKAKGLLSSETEAQILQSLAHSPALISEILTLDEHIAHVAHSLFQAHDMLYIARNSLYPIALEGALKLKEISYIHAEGYAAGELKHGPIALIDEQVPVVVIAPSTILFEKNISNLQEVAARGGRIILITDKEGAKTLEAAAEKIIILPDCDAFVAPILYTIPIQLLAYHIAVLKGTDVDQPRNLAKSVTVE
jgi:glucosamine--fructose-6-phosphate aminotransferase (isomerizing)